MPKSKCIKTVILLNKKLSNLLDWVKVKYMINYYKLLKAKKNILIIIASKYRACTTNLLDLKSEVSSKDNIFWN